MEGNNKDQSRNKQNFLKDQWNKQLVLLKKKFTNLYPDSLRKKESTKINKIRSEKGKLHLTPHKDKRSRQ